MAASPRGDPRSVLTRTFSILEAFTARDASLSLAELTRRTGFPKSTVYRIASELVDMGMLAREDESGGYRLGLQLFELGTLVPDQRDLRQVAIPYMEDLYEASKEVVHLGVLAAQDVLYIAKVAGHGQVPLPTRDGGRMPAHCTALGKAMLARSSRSTVVRVMEGGLPAVTRYTITVPKVLVAELAEVARAGVAFDREEAVLGSVCVAAAIIGPGGTARAALSVTGPSHRYDPVLMARAVRVAASAVSRQLGQQ